MLKKIKIIYDFILNMGLKYIFFRVFYIIKIKTGWFRFQFPSNPVNKKFISLSMWKKEIPPFFFYGKKINGLKRNPTSFLKNNINDIENNILIFFNHNKISLGKNYDWVTNPINGYRYDIKNHWTQIDDLSNDAGDIKYVWEKARFSFIYDIIRFDYHFNIDKSKYVFNEILDFIDKNPINHGPNYKCSQEISLRVLNWTFVLYYYKDSENLTNEIFCKIINSIYWQIHHVYNNINFSRISVRNNHALTEILLLFLSGILFPFLPNVKEWSYKGKRWFEKEIEYQIYPDGTYLQFSMNYSRIVIQLLTWAIQLSKLNGEMFNKIVYRRSESLLNFLEICSDQKSGYLPNYGANDGALFFKLTDNNFRNFRSQLDDLRSVLKNYTYHHSESSFWYGNDFYNKKQKKISEVNSFRYGGYYIIEENGTKTFIKCGSYKDRPSQADNLHIDIWINGENYIRDNGTYKYNTNKNNIKYFNGTEGHNTVSLDKEDQMLKGKRFIWYYWVKNAKGVLQKNTNYYRFRGEIEAFRHIRKNVIHKREIKKYFKKNQWDITDSVLNKNKMMIYQYWHIDPKYLKKIKITSFDENGNKLTPLLEEKWFSNSYGEKEKSLRYTFMTKSKKFHTQIKIL